MILINFILAIIFLVISIPVFVAVIAFATLLWPVAFICFLFDIIFRNKNKENSNGLEEFIFLCYGLALICLIWPFLVFLD